MHVSPFVPLQLQMYDSSTDCFIEARSTSLMLCRAARPVVCMTISMVRSVGWASSFFRFFRQ